MINMKELIKNLLENSLKESIPDFKGDILVEIPENKEHGDYTTNVSFSLAKILKKSPQETAEFFVDELKKRKTKDFSKIEAKGGFINFFLAPEYLYTQVKDILKLKNKYGFSKTEKPQKINMDFISANPTGPLTMGNGRGGFYGDVLGNVLETQGHEVVREYYINDRGEQISALGRSIKLAQTGGSFDSEEKLYHGEYINELAKKIDEKLNESEAGQKAIELVLEAYIKPAIKNSGIKFDNWFSEKTLYDGGEYKKIMEELVQKDLIFEKDGATWMKTTEFGDNEDRVLVKGNGDETYFMSDILYHFDKIKIRKFTKAIDIWGADHHGYAPRLKAALKAIDIPEENLEIIITQLVRLVKNGEEVKISKRAGNFITLEELIDEVGLDAARFFFLMYSLNTHMDFDIALAKERSEKNPVYYAQYAHARIASILRKAESTGKQNLELLKEKEELNLIKKLAEFPEILNGISKNYEIHRLPRYALELSRNFHNFYEKCRVITEDKDLTSSRLALASAAKIVLENSLNLMGIKAPDKM